MGISTIIFSMNRVENVVKLAEKVRPYVDEIVIIDSSKKENHQSLKKQLEYAKLYWFPPLGMPELYYKFGLDFCSHEWVIYFEDDEEPCEKLLVDLRSIIENYGEKYKVFRALKISNKQKDNVFRIFNKDYIIPIGLIHWLWGAKNGSDIFDLGDEYYVRHLELGVDDVDFGVLSQKLRRYSVIESYQYGFKILAICYKDYVRYQNPRLLRKIFKHLFEIFSMLNEKVALLISATLYNLFFFVKGLTKRPLVALYYAYSVQREILRDFGRKYKIWKDMWEIGDPIRYAGTDNLQNFSKIAEKLDPENGLKNFIALMEKRL